MTAETIVPFAILIFCIAPVIIIGIVQYRSRRVVGFWSGEKPPENEQVTDMKAYNHRHGMMWILYGLGFVLCFMLGWLWDEMTAAILCMIECIGGIFVMIACHKRWYDIYVKK